MHLRSRLTRTVTLVVAVALVTSSRLGDFFGRKRLFLAGMAVFALGSLLCSLSAHIHVASLTPADVLNISRGIQGIGGSAMVPLSLSLITATFHGRERGTAFGIWGGVSGLATALGPLVGGLLVSKVGWQSIFYLNVPIGAIGMGMGIWAIRESRDVHMKRAVDVYGLVTLTLALFCLVLALMQGGDKGWSSTYVLTLFIVGAISLVAFVLGELRIAHPMVDPRLFKIPSFTASTIAAFTLSGGLYALLFYLSLYMQNYLGFSPLQAGLRFLPLSALVLIGAPLAGRYTDRLGPKWILATGLVFVVVGTALLSRLIHATLPSQWLLLLPGLIVAGIGNGIVNPPISTLAMGTVDVRHLGMASGISNVARQTGVAFGIAALAALLGNRYNHWVVIKTHQLSASALGGVRARDAIISGLRSAGPIAGSLGLKTAGPAYTRLPYFSRISAIARFSFLIGTRDAVLAGAALATVGLLATVFMVRRQDLVHHREATAPLPLLARSRQQILALAVTAVWSARDGADPDAQPARILRLRRALALLVMALRD